MFFILGWAIYGFVVGFISRMIYNKPELPVGFLPTIGIGIVGSYIGGLINFLIGSGDPFSPSGLLMGILGGVIFCYVYSRYKINRFVEMRRKMHDQTRDS